VLFRFPETREHENLKNEWKVAKYLESADEQGVEHESDK
jgi:hypothetical protein